ncbi:Ig-like domain repeat protein [Frondihabitans sp. 762G35]|uniref:Ig-like domain repeat protein n=1 Tax=Frondihabitans sp. 762G35 TaxID=1446794 RepID=UPI000F4D6F55|nr:Ig-like domain repeat protein [Frondihabitans sp. 762G35]
MSSAGWWLTADVVSPSTGNSASFGVLALSRSADDAALFSYADVRAADGLNAVVIFDDDLGVDAKVLGSGSPFEEVILRNSAGDVVASTEAASDGSFEVSVPAPHRAQPYIVDVTQTLGQGGTVSDPVRVFIDYGAQVTITSPVDGSAHSGGALDFSGRGEPGGRVTIREAGKPAAIATADVLATGAWTARGVVLDGAEHKLEVKQLSKGNNTTTSTVTLNPGGTVTPPAPGIGFEVTTPKNDSTIETSDKQVTFTGRGNPGSKVTIMNGARTIGSVASVPASGNWSFTATMNYADYNLTAYNKKVPTGAVTSQQPLHITVAPGQVGFAVGSPAAGTTVDRGTFAFTGTGKAGSTVTVFLGSSKRGTATTAADGTWTVPVTVNTPGRYDFTVYYKANPADAAAPSVKHALTVR